MKKKYIISSITAIGTGLISYVLMDDDRRERVKKYLGLSQRSNEESEFPIEQAGMPEVDHLENANMVSEGSQFGVQYYNEVKT
ncbi:hypothetical protein [Alkalibacillus aidingensis]|uniref:hypothetical protein n=1 Tax=Alkalibacillus aidingensis TaxID=2747607 RepID=UPI00166188CB